MEDGAHGGHEDGGVEHGAVSPYHGHRQHDEQTAQEDQEPDEPTAEPPLARRLHDLELVPEGVALGSEPLQLLVIDRSLVARRGHRHRRPVSGGVLAHQIDSALPFIGWEGRASREELRFLCLELRRR